MGHLQGWWLDVCSSGLRLTLRDGAAKDGAPSGFGVIEAWATGHFLSRCEARGCPFGFDLDRAGLAGGVVPEAAPLVVFRLLDEAPPDRIAMNVDSLLDGLRVRGYVAVVVAMLPELIDVRGLEGAGGALLEDQEEACHGSLLRLVGEEVYVLGHQDVGDDAETLFCAGLLEDLFEGVFRFRSGEEGFSPVATEGDEVELPGLLVTCEAGWHGGWIAFMFWPDGYRRSGLRCLACQVRFVIAVVPAVYVPLFAMRLRRMGHRQVLGR